MRSEVGRDGSNTMCNIGHLYNQLITISKKDGVRNENTLFDLILLCQGSHEFNHFRAGDVVLAIFEIEYSLWLAPKSEGKCQLGTYHVDSTEYRVFLSSDKKLGSW